MATTGTGLTGEYFADQKMTQKLDARLDAKVDFAWGAGGLKLPQPNPFYDRLPKDTDLGKTRMVFAWSDTSGDGQMQPDEITYSVGDTYGVVFMPDLSVVTSSGMVLKPEKMTDAGVPIYNAEKVERRMPAEMAQRSPSSGGNQALLGKDGSIVFMNAPKPFSNFGPGGMSSDGRVLWSYPCMWPGLHASHSSMLPDRPGMMIGTTRLIGHPITPNADLGEVWAVNGNKGTVYLMTMDGLFVATLFKDSRTASWDFEKADRGMDVSKASLHEEDFWPTITQTKPDGAIYLEVEGSSNIVQLHGLDKAKRIVGSDVTVSPAELAEALKYYQQQEIDRQQANAKGPATLTIASSPAIKIDGTLDEWKNASWATIDQRETQVGNWGHRKITTAGTLSVSGDQLCIAIKTDDPELLRNSGETLQNLFKTGGGIDLMLDAVPGGERLLVTRVKNKTTAVFYRTNLPKGSMTGEPVQFSSPLRTVTIDEVKDVSDQIQLASSTTLDPANNSVMEARYELSVPLTLLNFTPTPGMTVHGDIGILRGNGFQTLQRVYWSNKATGLVSDIPSEAELTPKLWGTFTVK